MGTGGPDPPEKSQKFRIFSNTGPDPLKNHKTTMPEFNVGHHRHTSEAPFKWGFTGGPMMARLYWHLNAPFPHKLIKKKLSKLDPL